MKPSKARNRELIIGSCYKNLVNHRENFVTSLQNNGKIDLPDWLGLAKTTFAPKDKKPHIVKKLPAKSLPEYYVWKIYKLLLLACLLNWIYELKADVYKCYLKTNHDKSVEYMPKKSMKSNSSRIYFLRDKNLRDQTSRIYKKCLNEHQIPWNIYIYYQKL